MSSKIKYVLISLVFLLLSAVVLICFVVLKNNKTSSQPLTISSSDLTMQVGDSVSKFYNISNENATIEITADNPSIFEIDGNTLTALQAGSTKIVITASLDGDKAKTSFFLTIENSSYTFTVQTIQNCYENEGNFYLTDTACQFAVEVYDKLGQIYIPENMNYSASNEAIIMKEVTGFILVCSNNCTVTLTYPDIEFVIELNFIHA